MAETTEQVRILGTDYNVNVRWFYDEHSRELECEASYHFKLRSNVIMRGLLVFGRGKNVPEALNSFCCSVMELKEAEVLWTGRGVVIGSAPLRYTGQTVPRDLKQWTNQ